MLPDYTNNPLVPLARIELARPFEHEILSLGWLPITPERHSIFDTAGEIRTHTVPVLSRVHLPVVLRRHGTHGWIRTNTLLSCVPFYFSNP